MVADSILEANGKTKRDYIIEFIIRHDGCTQTAIIDYMAQAKHAVEKSPIHRQRQKLLELFLENLNLKQMIKETLY